MELAARRAIATLAGAAVVGLAGDLLLHGRPLGANVLALAVLFVAALAVVLRAGRAPLHQGRRWLALPLLVFAAAFAWHSSPLLVAVNTLALAGAVSLGALRRAQPRPGVATVGEYAAGLVAAGASTFAGSIELLERDVPWQEAARGFRGERAVAVARGLAIGAPFLLVFGGLFLAADSVFRQLVESALPTGLPQAWPHVLVATGIAWAAAGLLRDLAADRDERRLVSADGLVARKPSFRLGGVELTVALAVLDLLFAAFVAVQARYLFGGRGVVISHEHLTYAQYARHGFFELLAVSALVVPVVLAASSLARDHRTAVRVASALLVVLELAVAVSALQRMRVYVDQYGLTELRIYVTGVTLWIAAVLLWALATVLFGDARRFAVGAIVAGFVATLALNALDPDALIVRTNIACGHVDPAYLARLSDDSVPALVERLPSLTKPARAEIARALLARHISADPLAWNHARSEARASIAAHRAELEFLAR